MPIDGPTQRTNSIRTNQPKATAVATTTSRKTKSFRQATTPKSKPRFRLSTIGVLFLLTGGSCCALFGMGIFSSLRKSKAANSSVISRGTKTTTESCPSIDTTNMASRKDMENRLKGALWGFFAGDALASPTHWYYGGSSQIVSEYGHPIRDYTKPNQHLVGSILNKSDPNGGGRIKAFSKKSNISIIGDIINHGKLSYWDPKQSYHYHATLQKGENTLEVSLARVLMKSIVATHGNFDPDHFRNAYVEFMQTKGSHNDTYASTCHRMFFANLIFRKLPPKDCPDNDSHNVDTMDGLVLPTIVALTHLKNPRQIADSTGSEVTRKSEVLQDVAARWSEVVVAAVDESCSFSDSLTSFAKQTTRRSPNPKVRDSSTMSACYLGSSLPGLVDMVAKYGTPNDVSGETVWNALLSNANVGGENVHRGSIMGAVLGARAGYDALPAKLVDGLYAKTELEQEIEAFVNVVLPPNEMTSQE